MDNQHRKIKGYRELSQPEINLMNECKELAEQCGQLVHKIGQFQLLEGGQDEASEADAGRWLAIGQTDLQRGFMEIIRAIAKPETF